MPFSFAHPVCAPPACVFESPQHDDLPAALPPADPLPAAGARNKRKSPDNAHGVLEKAALSANARELILAQIASQTGLPRVCLQLHAVPEAVDAAGGLARGRLRVQIRCSAMLQPYDEWTSHQTWLRRQGDLSGDDVSPLDERARRAAAHEPLRPRSSIRRAPIAGDSARRGAAGRGVVFDPLAPQCLAVLDVPPDARERIVTSAPLADALEADDASPLNHCSALNLATPLATPACATLLTT